MHGGCRSGTFPGMDTGGVIRRGVVVIGRGALALPNEGLVSTLKKEREVGGGACSCGSGCRGGMFHVPAWGKGTSPGGSAFVARERGSGALG